MTARSPLLFPLQVLAASLGFAIVVMFTLWIRMPPGNTPALRTDPSRIDADAAREPLVNPVSVGSTRDALRAPAEARETSAKKSTAAVLYGTVHSAEGELVKRGVFWLSRDDRPAGVQSLRDGTFAFAGLRPGVHRLRSRIPDELPLDREIAVTAPTTRVDIELTRRWRLAVNVVTPSGDPLAEQLAKEAPRFRQRGITAAAFAEPLSGDLPLTSLAEVKTGLGTFRRQDLFARSRGEKALPKQTVGILTLPAGAPVHVALLLRNHVVAQERAMSGQEAVTFTIGKDEFVRHLATVRMRIVDAGGKPVTDARVAMNDAQSGGGGSKVGDDGRVTLRHLKPGRLDLQIMCRDLRGPPLQVDVGPGADLDLGDIVLRPGVTTKFVMDNFEGKGSVRFNCLDTPPPGMTCDDGYLSSDNGKAYSLKLYPGRYGMLASAANGVCLRIVDLTTPLPAPIRFDLVPGAPLTIKNRVGTGFVRLELASASGVVIRRRELTGTSAEIVRLPPGNYLATITDRNRAVKERRIALTSTGATLILP